MSVITLDQAKLYLRIDDDLDVDLEAELQLLIDAAESMVSEKTGYIFENQEKTYTPDPAGVVRVYDYPITDGLPADSTVVYKSDFVAFHATGPVTLRVGYERPTQVPPALVNAALQLLKHYYYESESQGAGKKMPQQVHVTLQRYKRFMI